jgi:hypothetical protein
MVLRVQTIEVAIEEPRSSRREPKNAFRSCFGASACTRVQHVFRRRTLIILPENE